MAATLSAILWYDSELAFKGGFIELSPMKVFIKVWDFEDQEYEFVLGMVHISLPVYKGFLLPLLSRFQEELQSPN
jgi:hypothetical protein